MRAKHVCLMLASVVALFVGLVIGHALRPSVDLRVCDPADLALPPPLFDRNSASYKLLDSDAVLGPIVRELRNWEPAGKIGPFVVYVNAKTDGYMIAEDNGQKAALIQETADGRTELSVLGKRHEIWVTLTYDETTGRPIRTSVEAPTKWIYRDDDCDGRFDVMVDCQRMVRYQQKGLEWIEIGRQDPGENSGIPGGTDAIDLGED